MRYSKLFGKAKKEIPAELKFSSHKLLYKAGFIRESTAGRYYFLPLGLRVHKKIRKIIKEEMDKTGGQEMLTPVLHPIALWKETNRTETASYELMKVKDRTGKEFVLGGTAEEMFVDLVRKQKLTYKDLPLNLYQFSMKFRDELRPRGGLLRVREFMMKDAYSFDKDEAEFKKIYQKMWKTYTKIFARMGLDTLVIEADNGYIGGEYCHEFVIESDIGESTFFRCSACQYAAHIEVARSVIKEYPQEKKLKLLKPVLGKGIIGVEELAAYLNIPVHATTKTLLFRADNRVVAAMIRGNAQINKIKLINYLKCTDLELADEKTVLKMTGAKVGYAGPVNLPKNIELIADLSTKNRVNFEAGANQTNYHFLNVNFERDFKTPPFIDIRTVGEGEHCPKCKKGKLVKGRGIEVGNIFQLGCHYSHLMKGAVFVGKDGKEKPYYMGCYGIGIGRTMAAIVEKHHDKKGIIWPKTVSPFDVHLVAVNIEKKQVKDFAEKVYQRLQKQEIDVLYDDREEVSAGVKFADGDLISIRTRLLISEETMKRNGVEWKDRKSGKTKFITLNQL